LNLFSIMAEEDPEYLQMQILQDGKLTFNQPTYYLN
jgi:hypothetical protein